MEALAGRYELVDQICGGERSALFKAWDPKTRQGVVVKRFEPARASADSLARYAAAVVSLRRCPVPGAVLPLEVVAAGPAPFAVFSPLVGESVAQLLGRGGPFSWVLAADIVARCAGVLAAVLAATGQSHRAIKPGNLWLAPTGEVSVLDLGVAELGVYPVPPRSGPVFVEYRAPEQLEGGLGDARSDVFALGILLHELSTGVHPFAGSSAFQVARQLILPAPPPISALTRGMAPGGSREAEKLLTRALARAPAERFAGPQEFLQALEFARRVIGSPTRLAPVSGAPVSDLMATTPVVVTDDPTTVMQPPGFGWQRRANPAQSQLAAPARSPVFDRAAVEPAPSLPISVSPELPASPVAYISPPPAGLQLRSARDLPSLDPMTESFSMVPPQADERTEVIQRAPPAPVQDPPTERDMAVVRLPRIEPQEDPRTVEFAKRIVPPASVKAESTLLWPGAVGDSEGMTTAAPRIPVSPRVAEATLILPTEATRRERKAASADAITSPVAAQASVKAHTLLIAFNVLCVTLVLLGLLLMWIW